MGDSGWFVSLGCLAQPCSTMSYRFAGHGSRPFALHGLSSDNLWDYLFDPVLMIVLGISLIRPLMSHRKIRTQS